MILFNSIFSQVTPKLSRDSVANYRHAPVFLKSSTSISKSFALAYTVKDLEALTVSTADLAKQNFIEQGRLQKILNNAWHQVIFLSASNRSYDKYIVDLSYLNTYKSQSTNRHLVSEFSRSLLQGSVSSSLSSESGASSLHASSLQYSWRKSLRGAHERISGLFHAYIYQNHLNRVKQYLDHNSSINNFPLFTVSNYLGQMIISEPPSELAGKRVIADCIAPGNGVTAYQGWFFASFEDAQEYMNAISEYYNLRKDHLKIFACSLNTFYMITNKFKNKVHFRLLPDLAELGNLTKSYKYYRNVSFHPSQNYGRNYFQGQPLYILQLKDVHKDHLVNHGFKLLDGYNLVFSSYDTACSTWNSFRSSAHVSVSAKPALTVYNLESLIADEYWKAQEGISKFLLIPSEKTYRFLKKHFLQKNISLLHDTVLNHAMSVKLWSKRILWSLTSKQPCGW